MLTKLTVRNFKGFKDVEIELGNPVAFIGPNNSGKTSAMQALALWEIGAKRWNERRRTKKTSGRGRGITINRRDLVAIPIPSARLLWHGLHVRDSSMVAGKQQNQNVRITVIVEGITDGKTWTCGLEFDYANEESLFCRPARVNDYTNEWMEFPPEAAGIKVAFLPPMSGLTATETRLDRGAIDVRVGEGRTAEVLRNLCQSIYETPVDDKVLLNAIRQSNHAGSDEVSNFRLVQENPIVPNWTRFVDHIRKLFGVDLLPPEYISERGEISMSYQDRGVELDISSSGRGLQQTMLILSYMYANPGSVLLLDEPDAHLEILRQRQIYRLISDVAKENDTQIIAASHSEVILNEAAGKDMLIAFVGKPHRVDNRRSEVLKSLSEIGFEHFYQAEQTGWVLYLEGPTDLAILQAFADKLGHDDARHALERPFVHYVGNQARMVRAHFPGLKEAIPTLRGIVVFDRFNDDLPDTGMVECIMWRQREIENYLCTRSTLESFARRSALADSIGPLFDPGEINRRVNAMNDAIDEIEIAMQTLGRGSPWDRQTKTSDDFLTPLFDTFFKKLGLPNLMRKKDFYELAEHVPQHEIDSEVTEKLDAIAETAKAAKPRIA